MHRRIDPEATAISIGSQVLLDFCVRHKDLICKKTLIKASAESISLLSVCCVNAGMKGIKYHSSNHDFIIRSTIISGCLV